MTIGWVKPLRRPASHAVAAYESPLDGGSSLRLTHPTRLRPTHVSPIHHFPRIDRRVFPPTPFDSFEGVGAAPRRWFDPGERFANLVFDGSPVSVSLVDDLR